MRKNWATPRQSILNLINEERGRGHHRRWYCPSGFVEDWCPTGGDARTQSLPKIPRNYSVRPCMSLKVAQWPSSGLVVLP